MHPMTESQVLQEIEHVKSSPLPAERFGFVTRAGFDKVHATVDRRLYTLKDVYRSE